MIDKTVFQKMIDREIKVPVLYEDDHTFVFLDDFPIDKGHCLVIPKTPYIHIWDMPESEYVDLQKIVRKMAIQMKDKLGKDIAIFQRNGHDAGQEVMHLHVHLLPRFETEETKPVFNYSDPHAKIYSSEEEKQSFVEKLKLG